MAALFSTLCAIALGCFSASSFAGPIEFDLTWNGPNNFSLRGSFTFDEALLGQDIDEGDLLSFSFEAFSGTTSLGEFNGIPADFNFNSSLRSFDHPLSWNAAGPGIGYNTSQSTISGNTYIGEQLVRNGAQIPGSSRSFLFEPGVRGTLSPPAGQLPWHIYSLVIAPGDCPHPNPALPGCDTNGDTLPVGGNVLYLFSLFDTGADTIAINNAGVAGVPSDADLLNLCRPTGGCSTNGVDGFLPPSLVARIWGLGAVDPVTGNAPINNPQSQEPAIRVRTFSGPTLIGGPLTARTVAIIDYATEIERSFDFGTPFKVWAPDMTFYDSRAAARLPIIALELELERVGNFDTSPIDGASRGPRYSMKNIELKNGNVSIDDAGHRFLYDTGNTVTQMIRSGAIALGIDPDNDTPAHVRKISGPNGSFWANGYIIDELTITSTFGDPYTVSSPLIYVLPAGQILGGVDANIGSDIFRDTRIVFSGPDDRILIPRENYPSRHEFIVHGDGTISDPTSGLMWLQDASYAMTTSQGPNGDGKMPWNDAMTWADGLVFVGYDDWRLPATLEPDPQCVPSSNPNISTLKGCRGSEMGYLYWTQGVTAVTPGPFLNVPRADYNWSSTLHSSGALTWVHSFRHGEQGAGNNGPGIRLPAWPVRDVLPSDTNPGSGVEVSPVNGVRLVFDTINTGGATTVSITSTNPVGDPANFQLLGNFYDIETTAGRSGNVTVCLEYPAGTDTSTLELLHWDGSDWVPLSGAIIDTNELTICAVSPSLSWFAIGQRKSRGFLWLLFAILLILGV